MSNKPPRIPVLIGNPTPLPPGERLRIIWGVVAPKPPIRRTTGGNR